MGLNLNYTPNRLVDITTLTEDAPIVEEMGTACKGTCEQGGECFKVSYNPLYREGISKDRLSALRAQYPDIYDEFVDQTESRIFKVVKSAIA